MNTCLRGRTLKRRKSSNGIGATSDPGRYAVDYSHEVRGGACMTDTALAAQTQSLACDCVPTPDSVVSTGM